jgi:hypothetical protein
MPRRLSALPPKADITMSDWHVRLAPKAEVSVIRSVELNSRVLCSTSCRKQPFDFE